MVLQEKVELEKCFIPRDDEKNLIGWEKFDYFDSYQVRFTANRNLSIEDCLKQFFLSMPAWVNILLDIRNFIASKIGLKVASRQEAMNEILKFKGQPDEKIALFLVFANQSGDLVVGANDRHLDFRLIVSLERVEDRVFLAYKTFVNYKNFLGPLYFLPVRPIHKIIMPIIVKRIAKDLREKFPFEEGLGR